MDMPAALRTYADVRPEDTIYDNFAKDYVLVRDVEEDGPEVTLWLASGDTLTAEADHPITVALGFSDHIGPVSQPRWPRMGGGLVFSPSR